MARTDTLGHFLTDVADAIREKTGSSEAIPASDFDTEIENIPSGSTTPTTLTELNESIVALADDFIDYVRSLPQTYSTYTNEPVTLYSPANEYNYYLIQKRSSGKYRVAWFKFDIIRIDAESIYPAKWSTNYSSQTYADELHNAFNTNGTVQLQGGSADFYYSSEYNTVNECVEKMLNNELTYTYAFNYLAYVADTPYILPYTNASVLRKGSSVYVAEPVLSQKISQNETIAVIE